MRGDGEGDVRVGKVFDNLPWGNGDSVLSDNETGSLKGRKDKTRVTSNLESSTVRNFKVKKKGD